MAVKLLRLKSGEDIVTDVKKENAEYTTIGLPAMLVPMSHSADRGRIKYKWLWLHGYLSVMIKNLKSLLIGF